MKKITVTAALVLMGLFGYSQQHYDTIWVKKVMLNDRPLKLDSGYMVYVGNMYRVNGVWRELGKFVPTKSKDFNPSR